MTHSSQEKVTSAFEQSSEKKIEDVKVPVQKGSLKEDSFEKIFSIDEVEYQVLREDFPSLTEQQI